MSRYYDPPRRVPVGVILPYVGVEVPENTPRVAPGEWLPCDGRAIERESYPDLFALIGTTYGAGDGESTFNIPDLRGRMVLGLDNLGGTSANRVTASAADALGGTLGVEKVALSDAQMPSHSHGASTGGAGAHAHLSSNGALGVAAGGQGPAHATLGGPNVAPQNNFTSAVGDHAHSVSIAAAGGGQAHENMPPAIALGFIIRVLPW